MPNALIYETSPYLLQHAHNPVDWYPWGEAALQKAIDEDKPVLVSIGYAACHWCHVMERESFEDKETAALMNEHFINIKIDREERPDLDHIYMDAVQAMSGGGGWPLNVFLTPAKQPFYGGTYFPPKPVMNRPSWQQVLTAVADAFKNKRSEIEQQAKGLTEHLFQANNFGINDGELNVSIEEIDRACDNLLKQADKQWGGFGAAPKFPQTFSIQFLLRYYHYSSISQASKNSSPSPLPARPEHRSDGERGLGGEAGEAALQQALLSLDKMIDGGIYDQVGGGFARYSTDTEWLAPHFEKMLYDNALLVSVLSEAYQITKNEKYKATIEHTLAFIEREMLHNAGGFYAALDADSEGEEGKFYVWSREEIQEVLGEDAELFCAYYNISESGNWEGKNILRVPEPLPVFASNRNLVLEELEKLLGRCREKLLKAREQRTRPALDDKIILGWNALMNIAYSNAYAATGNEHYRTMVITNMNFILAAFRSEGGSLNHVWKNNTSKFPAFLDDYAYLIRALLQLHRVTADTGWLQKAKLFCETVIKDFTEEDGYFYYTPVHQQDVIVRKKEVYDGATPSGNAVMAQNLLELGLLFENNEWKQRAQAMLSGLSNVAVKYPGSFGIWLSGLYQFIKGTKEIVITGDYKPAMKEILSVYLPFSVIMAATTESNDFPLLQGKTAVQPLAIYLCENYACKEPVFSVKELLAQL